MKKILLLIFLIGAVQVSAWSRNPANRPKPSGGVQVDFRGDCQPGDAQVDLDVNNVRARLLSRGDFWWDYNDAKYIVPNVDPASGLPEVSSIFAGAVWMGGFDPAGNLKIAASDYANSGADFYPGPLDENGLTDAPICDQWDRHFLVKGADIDAFLAKWRLSGGDVTEDDIPDELKSYPAKGNPFFLFQPNGFPLPDQDLAPFHDQNEDGIFNPLDGDYPVIQIRGCPDTIYADQMYFQIYNDNGGPHKISNGVPIRMEVQVQAFGFATNDELNDMTFMRYRLINKAQDTIQDCYFAMWVDADLGCDNDDFVGCDTSRSLAYYYGADDIDGEADCSCPSGANTYCTKIPLIGIDYFRGPLDEFGNELGMSSFTYYNRPGTTPPPPPNTTDPGSATEFYNYLTGRWRDGSPYYGGDDGFQDPQYPVIKYAFPGYPDDPNGWSMAQSGAIPADRRTVQASGPFTLVPGATNELIIGLPWVPNVEHPAPDITKLLAADDKAQNLFDACFNLTDGPDAPDLEVIELDQGIVLTLTNSTVSNNYKEEYKGADLGHAGQFYHFEGYLIYQTKSANVSLAQLNDPDVSRLVAQSDVKNGISKLYNWEIVAKNPDPNNPNPIYAPKLMVAGQDKGIKHSYYFTKDAFGVGEAPLINHRKYYYVAVAYASNNFEPFDPETGTGQNQTFLVGRKTAYGLKIKPVTVIPRPSTYDLIGASYGDGPVVTRISGLGTGTNFLKISKDMREAAIDNTGDKPVTYLPGKSPINVKVVNPFKVQGGKFRFTITDGTSPNDPPHSIDGNDSLRWTLDKLDENGNVVATVTSERDLSFFNEQIISEFGISIEIGQVKEPGVSITDPGAYGIEVTYADPDKPQWLISAKDDTGIGGSPLGRRNINFVSDNDVQPNKAFTENVDNAVAFYPFFLLNTQRKDDNTSYFITPGWIDNKAGIMRKMDSLYHLNNVDIVLTSDKSKWSRCVVLEAASSLYGISAVGDPGIKPVGNRKQYRLRAAPSVGKDADADGNPVPDGDGEGMGWFPGYAVDVETGKRLNILFAENSTFRVDDDIYPPSLNIFNGEKPRGGDMMFNPSSIQLIDMGFVQGTNPLDPEPTVNSMYLGGQHVVMVTYDEYDGCAQLRQMIESAANSTKMAKPLAHIQWAGMLMAAPGEKMLSYADGLIPNDVTISLRAANPYTTTLSSVPVSASIQEKEYGPLPVYEFDFNGLENRQLTTEAEINNALDAINVVPNPYYGYAYYERSQFTTIVKITNLPAKCTVTIYSLDGKFIKRFKRDEAPFVDPTTGYARQIAPDIEWDLKNASGIPVASGVYLIHVKAPGLGERVIKWFGMNRQFDPSGL